jgi:hypothetical protein
MRNLAVSAAVAAVLASGAAVAKNVDIYISGASAQRNFWYDDLPNIAGCAAATLQGATWKGPSTAPYGTPDFSFVQCTSTAGGLAGSGIAVGDVVTFHYSAELGSVWGIANALGVSGVAGYPLKHIFLQFNAADCVLGAYVVATNKNNGTCTPPAGTGQYALYTPGLGAATGTDTIVGNPAEFISVQPDIDVADLEPGKFALADNWPTAGTNFVAPEFAALGPVPTAKQLTLIKNGQGGGQLNGEVFAVITNGVPGGDPTSLSSTSIQSIVQGTYQTWSQVPEVGPASDPAGTQIILCRRDHGSGTQTFASLTFTGTECGLPNIGTYQAENGTTVIVNGTTGNVKTCVNGHAGSIGFVGLTGNLPGATDTFKIEAVDGVAANGHNAAAGYYKYASQTYGANGSVVNAALAKLMLSRSQTVAGLAAALGTETATPGANHLFTVGAGTSPIGYFALPVGTNPNTVTGLNVSPGVPTAVAGNNSESCTVNAGTNSGT